MGRQANGSFVITLLLLLAICCYSFTSHASAPKTDLLAYELQQAIDNKVKELKVPGMQVAVRSGDFYWSGTSGSTGFDSEEELAKDHNFSGW